MLYSVLNMWQCRLWTTTSSSTHLSTHCLNDSLVPRRFVKWIKIQWNNNSIVSYRVADSTFRAGSCESRKEWHTTTCSAVWKRSKCPMSQSVSYLNFFFVRTHVYRNGKPDFGWCCSPCDGTAGATVNIRDHWWGFGDLTLTNPR
jgi:hypothetical protein